MNRSTIENNQPAIRGEQDQPETITRRWLKLYDLEICYTCPCGCVTNCKPDDMRPNLCDGCGVDLQTCRFAVDILGVLMNSIGPLRYVRLQHAEPLRDEDNVPMVVDEDADGYPIRVRPA